LLSKWWHLFWNKKSMNLNLPKLASRATDDGWKTFQIMLWRLFGFSTAPKLVHRLDFRYWVVYYHP
jgi:hypothetical protein